MADIELVIKIPDYLYEDIKESNTIFREDERTCYEAVQNGIPLPKGHGRIVDMDAAIECIEEVTGDDAFYAISLIEWACGKRTIIEADKESE